MKKLLNPVSIVLLIVLFLLLLPFLLPKKATPTFSDTELRELALSLGMAAVPTTYDELLKVTDNPQNPLTPQKIKLGKELFFDTRLSRHNDINCASCHKLDEGGDDNLPTAIGDEGRENPSHLNSPTVLNAALAIRQFWNGSAKDVEEQAGGPIQAHFEMNMTPAEIEKRVKESPSYVEKFKNIFGEISFENVKKAIGAYERTLLTYGSYDEFLNGDDSAISKKAKKGMTTFIIKGCKGCHAGMSVGGQSMQKFPLRKDARIHDLRPNLEINPELKIIDRRFPFENIGGFLGKDNNQIFRVPILRNITKTSPYFHNGSIKEIEKVVEIMGRHQIGVVFSKDEIEEIVEFLKTLEGDLVDYKID
jgi:cytochrome c peroxidase